MNPQKIIPQPYVAFQHLSAHFFGFMACNCNRKASLYATCQTPNRRHTKYLVNIVENWGVEKEPDISLTL